MIRDSSTIARTAAPVLAALCLSGTGCRSLVPETIQDINRAGGTEEYHAMRVNHMDEAALRSWRRERDADIRQAEKQ